MAKKIFTYRGKTIEEIQNLSMKEFAELLPSRERRTLNRGFTDLQKRLLEKVQKNKKNIETHCRDTIIVPNMVTKTIKIFSGKEFVPVIIQPDMIGHRLGEFVLTRKSVKHSAPGIGATKSSAHVSVR